MNPTIGELPDQPELQEDAVKGPVDVEMMGDEKPTQETNEAEDGEPISDDAITENPDGSVDVDLGEDESQIESEEFMENLAELLDESYLRDVGTEYEELIEMDKDARAERDKQYAEGIKRTGLGNEAPGGAAFEGASKVVHPMLAKGCVDFASRAIKELFPATGPCKTQIIGEQTEQKLDKAERKKRYMNWQSTTQIEENRAALERLLSQVPLGGAQYKRWWWDPELKRPCTEAMFIDDVFIPYGQSDFYTSPRVSYRQRILRTEYDRRVRTGLYRDLDLGEPGLAMSDDSASRAATDKVVGADSDASAYNKDGLRTVWCVEALMECEDDPLLEADQKAPYIIHLDEDSGRVLGLFRNWRETDDRFRKKHWVSEWQFIPWRDGPAVGLAHLIGSMAGAATGSLRAILDAAHINNFPGAMKLKGGRNSASSVTVNATEIVDIDAPAGVDDIRKLVMAFPFNGPSPVLFQVMEWLTQQAEAVVSTASDKIADGGANMPVGTAMALIEHGSANFSAVHARLHGSMKRDLEILHRLDAEHLEDEETVEDLGELVVHRSDFDGPMDIIPVSDPNIFSETQRYAQLQAVLQLLGMPNFASYFKADQLLARFLKLLQIPDIDGITNLPKETQKLSATDENYAVAMAERPLKVYQDQDDLAHLQSHIHFATSPMFGAHPLIAPQALPGLLQHCKDHMMALYRKHVRAAKSTVQEITAAQGISMTEEQCETAAGGFMDKVMAGLLTPIVMPGLQTMQQAMDQIAQASAPKPDPNIMAQEKTKMDLGMAKIQSDEKKQGSILSDKAAERTIEQQIEAQGAAATSQLAALASSVELIRDQQNNGAKQLQMEFTAAQERNMLFLSTVLTQVMSPTPATPTPTGLPGEGAAGGSVEGAPPQPTESPVTAGVKSLFDPKFIVGPMVQALQAFVSEQMSTASKAQEQNLEAILLRERTNNETALAKLGESLTAIQQQSTAERQVELYRDPITGQKRARSFVPPQPQPQPQPQLPQGPQQ